MIAAGLSASMLIGCTHRLGSSGLAQTQVRVAAPFPIPPISIPDFTGAKRFSIADFGAAAGDQARTDAAIACAIDAAAASGGGVVVVPAGSWDVGPIHLKSNVNLHVSEGATLRFSPDSADYLPPVHSSWEGIECFNYSPLIYAYECENVALTGKGTLEARLDIWEECSSGPSRTWTPWSNSTRWPAATCLRPSAT